MDFKFLNDIDETATGGNPPSATSTDDLVFLDSPPGARDGGSPVPPTQTTTTTKNENEKVAETLRGPNLNQIAKFTPRKFAQSVLNVFQEIGGATWLMAQAKADPKLFIELLKKILPNNIAIDGQDGLVLNIIKEFVVNQVPVTATGGAIDVSGKNIAETRQDINGYLPPTGLRGLSIRRTFEAEAEASLIATGGSLREQVEEYDADTI